MTTPLGPFPQLIPERSATNPHFAAIGGAQMIAQLVERFYHHMDTEPAAARIRALHPKELTHVKDVLRRYLTEWMGGPKQYSVERGHPHMRQKHMRFAISEAERDAWMLCMRAALAEVVPDAALRAQLDAAFYRVADAVRNTASRVTLDNE